MINRIKKIGSIFVFFLCFLFIHASSISADSSNTQTLSSEGDLVSVQSIYAPSKIISSFKFDDPQDIFYHDGNLFLLDSQNSSIYVIDPTTNQIIEEIRVEGAINPTGFTISHLGNFYVADSISGVVLKLDPQGHLIQKYERPQELLFGSDTKFQPTQVYVDLAENIYIVSEGTTNGIITMNNDGKFLGFYGANETRLSFIQQLQNILSTINPIESDYFKKVPPAPTNILIDDQGMVYTVTNLQEGQTLRKINVSGMDLWGRDNLPAHPIDLVIDTNRSVYVLTQDSFIDMYDQNGNLLFQFGGMNSSDQRIGLFNRPKALAIDEYNNLYVLDQEAKYVHVLEPTEFIKKINQGISLYNDGLYDESLNYFSDVLRLNPYFNLAHQALGEAAYKNEDYKLAISHFKNANDYHGYSKAFWEVRNIWLRQYLWVLLLVVLITYITFKMIPILIKHINRKQKNTPKKIEPKFKISFIQTFKHPIDSVYYLKRNEFGSMKLAFIYLGLFLCLFAVYLLATGYLFNPFSISSVSLWLILLVIFMSFIIIVTVNYLVSTLNDGEGTWRQTFIGLSYSLGPIFVGVPLVVILSNVLTYNESFLVTLIYFLMISLTIGLMLIVLKELHNFTIMELLKNILLTIFAIFILLIVASILILLWDQLIGFLLSVGREVVMDV